jgi:hypothetical protein
MPNLNAAGSRGRKISQGVPGRRSGTGGWLVGWPERAKKKVWNLSQKGNFGLSFVEMRTILRKSVHFEATGTTKWHREWLVSLFPHIAQFTVGLCSAPHSAAK